MISVALFYGELLHWLVLAGAVIAVMLIGCVLIIILRRGE